MDVCIIFSCIHILSPSFSRAVFVCLSLAVIHSHTHTHRQTHTHTHTHTIYIYIAYIHTYIPHLCIYKCKYTYIHTYTHAYINTYTYIHIYIHIFIHVLCVWCDRLHVSVFGCIRLEQEFACILRAVSTYLKEQKMRHVNEWL